MSECPNTTVTGAALLAFLVHDDDSTDIHFAASAEELAEELGMDPSDPDIERAPAFDAFAPGPIPVAVLLSAGWWLECGHCNHHVSKEGCDGGEDDDECEGLIVVHSDTVFCSAACLVAEQDKRARHRAQLQAQEAEVQRIVGPVTIVDSWVGGVEFRAPGCEGRIRWDAADSEHVRVEARDLAAYTAWKLTRPPAAAAEVSGG